MALSSALCLLTTQQGTLASLKEVSVVEPEPQSHPGSPSQGVHIVVTTRNQGLSWPKNLFRCHKGDPGESARGVVCNL
jgi:hypothetical protein